MPACTANAQNRAQNPEHPQKEVPPQGARCISSVGYENKSAVVKNIHGNNFLF